MSEDQTALSEREEIEMLLPWYVGGTLDETDRDRVERYLAHHPELHRQLDLIREERHETTILNEALPVAPAGGLERLLASLPARRIALAQWLSESEGWRALGLLFSQSAPRAVRFAATAAALLLLAQGVAITAFILKSHEGTYETAAGGERGQGLAFFIAFTDAAPSAAVTAWLRDLDARIVDGPKPGGIYRIEVRTNDRSPSAEEALRGRLAERRDLVRLIVPAKE